MVPPPAGCRCATALPPRPSRRPSSTMADRACWSRCRPARCWPPASWCLPPARTAWANGGCPTSCGAAGRPPRPHLRDQSTSTRLRGQGRGRAGRRRLGAWTMPPWRSSTAPRGASLLPPASRRWCSATAGSPSRASCGTSARCPDDVALADHGQHHARARGLSRPTPMTACWRSREPSPCNRRALDRCAHGG